MDKWYSTRHSSEETIKLMMENVQFCWWHVVDGFAVPLPDTKEVCELIDSGKLIAYATVEGAIKYGRVQATAFKRTREMTYDAAEWLRTGKLVPAGYVTTTKITAEPVKLVLKGE